MLAVLRRLAIGGELFVTVVQIAYRGGQVADLTASHILFVQVVLFQNRQSLQLGIRLSERQNGGIAGGNRLHFRIRQFLTADVFGPARGVVVFFRRQQRFEFFADRLPAFVFVLASNWIRKDG